MIQSRVDLFGHIKVLMDVGMTIIWTQICNLSIIIIILYYLQHYNI